MKFESWYKGKIESLNLSPPQGVWDDIQDRLDIDNSWELINASLNRRRRMMILYRGVAAAGLIIMILSAYLIFNKVETAVQEPALAEITGESEGMVISDEPVYEVNVAGDEAIIDIAISHEPIVITAVNDALTGKLRGELSAGQTGIQSEELTGSGGDPLDEISIVQNINKNTSIPLITKSGIGGSDLFLNKDMAYSIKEVSPQSPDQADKKRTSFRKIYLGACGQLANTWLLNQKTYSAFKSTSLVSTSASFGSNFGLYAGTNLYKNLDLQADLNMLVTNRQDYHEYLDGNFISNTLRFSYSQLALLLRYNFISKRIMIGEHGLNLGVYGGYLHKAGQLIEPEVIDMTQNYNPYDYGLVAGYEYVFPLFENTGMGAGFRTYYGLSNIYSGDGVIPSHLNETKNASVNITLSLKYHIK